MVSQLTRASCLLLLCLLATSSVSRAETPASQPTSSTKEDPLAAWRNKICRDPVEKAKTGSDRDKVEAGFINLGYHCPRDYAAALHWFRLAADHGYPQGIYWLGMMYKDGLGVEKDEKKAFAFIRRSALMDGGDLWEQEARWKELSNFYERGIGIPANAPEAYFSWKQGLNYQDLRLQKDKATAETLNGHEKDFFQFRVNEDQNSLKEDEIKLQQLKSLLTAEELARMDARK